MCAGRTWENFIAYKYVDIGIARIAYICARQTHMEFSILYIIIYTLHIMRNITVGRRRRRSMVQATSTIALLLGVFVFFILVHHHHHIIVYYILLNYT